MAESCDANGDYGNDFNRRNKVVPEDVKIEEPSPSERKSQEYVKELLAEKLTMDPKKHPHAWKLLDDEVSKVQIEGKIPNRDAKYVDIYREKPIRVVVKVLVPVSEYPKFNFVGKLLGPKGNSLRRLQEETMCKMAILGRGSMRDRAKEEECRISLDPKFAHLTDELHVEIAAMGPAAEAHARITFALAEIRKYLIPDSNDNIRKEQLREMENMPEHTGRGRPDHAGRGRPELGGRGPSEHSPPVKRPGVPRGAGPRPPIPMRTATRMPVHTPRVMPAKTKIMSILDRARVAMEESYGSGYGSYEESYDYGNPYDDYPPPSSSRPHSYSERRHNPEYEFDYYKDGDNGWGLEDGESPRRWKSVKMSARYRSSPYSRSAK